MGTGASAEVDMGAGWRRYVWRAGKEVNMGRRQRGEHGAAEEGGVVRPSR